MIRKGTKKLKLENEEVNGTLYRNYEKDKKNKKKKRKDKRKLNKNYKIKKRNKNMENLRKKIFNDNEIEN